MKHIRLFEDWETNQESTTLPPQDMSRQGEVVIAWGMDGMCAALLSREEISLLLQQGIEDLATLPVKISETPGISYVLGDKDGEYHFKGPNFEAETASIYTLVGSETFFNDDSERLDDVVMSLKRGHVTFTLAGGHTSIDGQLPLSQFIEEHLSGV